MSLKDIIAPLYVWKRAFEKPYAIKKPIEERLGAPRYRGFHMNDLEKCIGCGTCEAICQNRAIDMVPVEGIKTTKNDSGLRPKIDYGRCCWCALCVDICTTGSLRMTNEYIWIDTDPDVFRFVPGAENKPWDKCELGYKKASEYTLLNLKRVKMPVLPGRESVKSFIEMVKGYSKKAAQQEADRCVECGLCVATCPAHMDIPEYIRAVRENNMEEGLRILYKTNPFPAVCGRICTHRCEEVCALSHTGDPISIRWLKRYIVDQIVLSDYEQVLAQEIIPNYKKVAIIGAGPGGLSAAYYLALLGYDITVYETNEHAGGMLRYGIPEYRLPYDQLDKDIEYIHSLGVKIACNTRIGEDIPFNDLLDRYDAIFYSTGLSQPYRIEIAGEDDPNVISGLELLDDVTKGKKPNIGKKVAVIGGGNVAMDAARTARRFGSNVTIIYRRREVDMPADEEEIHDTRAERVKFITQAIPLKIEKTDKGRLRFIWGKARMVDDGPGRRPKPVLIEGRTYSVVADTIIVAIGQGGDYDFLSKEIAEKITFKRGKVVTNEYGQTEEPKIFAGGDIVNRTADAISAIADGHRAAKGIDKYLQSEP
jgi:glutamate synthase (NADPH/NADH) small chain